MDAAKKKIKDKDSFKLLRYLVFRYRKVKRLCSSREIINSYADEFEPLFRNRDAEKTCVFFVCIPQHKNLGDQAQKYCIENWIKKNYPDACLYEIPTWPFYNKKFQMTFSSFVRDRDVIIIQSGYCTTDSHIDHDIHRWIVQRFSLNPILIMPQTVNFRFSQNIRRTAEIYKKHKHLLFLARDRQSYEMARESFTGCNILLYPDIVTTLIGIKSRNADRDGVLLCIRNDGEKKYGDSQIDELKRCFLSKGIKCDLKDTNSEKPLEYLKEHFKEEFDRTIEDFSKYKVVITDRYHGTIFSMISNTPVIVLATNDHKVKTGTEWFKGIYDGGFFNADSIGEAVSIAEGCMRNDLCIQNKSYFQEHYYDRLMADLEKVQ